MRVKKLQGAALPSAPESITRPTLTTRNGATQCLPRLSIGFSHRKKLTFRECCCHIIHCYGWGVPRLLAPGGTSTPALVLYPLVAAFGWYAA